MNKLANQMDDLYRMALAQNMTDAVNWMGKHYWSTTQTSPDRDVQQTPVRRVDAFIAIMGRHGLQPTEGDNRDLWTAARELVAKSLALASSAELVEELHSRISSSPTTGTING